MAVDGEGRRQVLGVELANRESRSSWRDFLSGLKQRGLFGVEFVVSDDHEGLKQAIREVLPGAAWQRCYVHYADLRIMPSDHLESGCGGHDRRDGVGIIRPPQERPEACRAADSGRV